MITQSLLNGLATAALIYLTALGLLLIMKSSGVLHFAHGAAFTVAAYAAYTLHGDGGLALPWSAVAGVVMAALLGATVEALIYRSLRERGSLGLTGFIASLGLYIAAENLIALGFGPTVRVFPRGGPGGGLRLGDAYLSQIQLVGLIVALAVAVAWVAVRRLTRFGVQVRAFWNDGELALCMGLPVARLRLVTVGFGSALAGAAGILAALDTALTPGMGMGPLLLAFVAVVIGDNTPVRVAGAAALLGLLLHLSVFVLSVRWQNSLVFSLLIAFLLAQPRGQAVVAGRRGGR